MRAETQRERDFIIYQGQNNQFIKDFLTNIAKNLYCYFVKERVSVQIIRNEKKKQINRQTYIAYIT